MPVRIPKKHQQMKQDGASPVDVWVAMYRDADNIEITYISGNVVALFDIERDSEKLAHVKDEAYKIIYAKHSAA